MHKYNLVLMAQPGEAEQQYEFLAEDVTPAFGWAERNAGGRRLEIFEDGNSLGVAALARDSNFWVLSPASGRGVGEA